MKYSFTEDKLPPHLEWKGKVRYSGINSGSVCWKSGSIIVKNQNGIVKCCVMLDCNKTKPALNFCLNPDCVKKIIAKSQLIIELTSGLTISFKDGTLNLNVIKELESVFQIFSMKKNKELVLSNKAEVKMTKVSSGASVPLGSKGMNGKFTYSRPPTPQLPRFTSVKENRKPDHKTKPEKQEDKENKESGRKDQPLFEDVEDCENYLNSSTLISNGKVGDQFLQRGTEKSRLKLKTIETTGFYSSSRNSQNFGSPLTSGSVIKRKSEALADLPLKRIHLFTEPSTVSKTHHTSEVCSKQIPLQGFSNLGNTCYMNAILQALFGLDTFTTDLLRVSRQFLKVAPRSLHCALAKLLISRKKHLPEFNRIELLGNVKDAIGSVTKRFSNNQMQDAHELLGQILDTLKEEVHNLGTSTPSPNKENMSVKSSYSEDFTNPIVQNFEFEMTYSFTCLRCHETSTKDEKYIDLSLDIPRGGNATIQDALDLFFVKEQVDYRCAKCGHGKFEAMNKFCRIPRVLIIHLKRYAYSVSASRNTKVGHDISIPKYLTLQSHCETDTRLPIPAPTILSPLKFRTSFVTDPLTPRRRLDYSKSGDSAGKYQLFKLGKNEKTDELGVCRLTDNKTPLKTNSRKISASPVLPVSETADVDAGADSLLANDSDYVPKESIEEQEQKTDAGEEQMDCSDGNHNQHFVSSFELHNLSEEEQLKLAIKNSLKDTEQEPDFQPLGLMGSSKDHCKVGPAHHKGYVLNAVPACLHQQANSKDERAQKNADNLAAIDDVENKENQMPNVKQDNIATDKSQENGAERPIVVTLGDDDTKKREDDDIRKAKEISLNDFDKNGEENEIDFGCSVEETLKRSSEQMELLKKNEEKGHLPFSYRLVSVVAHLGSSSQSGHYLCDIFDVRRNCWFSCDDQEVLKITEKDVQVKRQDTGYIFFYLCRNVYDQLQVQNTEPAD